MKISQVDYDRQIADLQRHIRAFRRASKLSPLTLAEKLALQGAVKALEDALRRLRLNVFDRVDPDL